MSERAKLLEALRIDRGATEVRSGRRWPLLVAALLAAALIGGLVYWRQQHARRELAANWSVWVYRVGRCRALGRPCRDSRDA